MTDARIFSGIVVMVLACSLFACSQSSDTDTDRGAIDEITHQAAEDAMDAIQTPLNKARSARDKANSRMDPLGDVEE